MSILEDIYFTFSLMLYLLNVRKLFYAELAKQEENFIVKKHFYQALLSLEGKCKGGYCNKQF